MSDVKGLLINVSLEQARKFIEDAKKKDKESGERYHYKIRARGDRNSKEVYDYGFDQLEKYFAKTGKKTIDLSPEEVQMHMRGIHQAARQSIPLALGKTFTVYKYKVIKESDDKPVSFNEFLSEGKAPKNQLPKEFDLIMKDLGVTYATADSIYVQDPDTQSGIEAHWVKQGKINAVSKHHDDMLNKLRTSKFKQISVKGKDSQAGYTLNTYYFLHNATGTEVVASVFYDISATSNRNRSSVAFVMNPIPQSNEPDEIDRIIKAIP